MRGPKRTFWSRLLCRIGWHQKIGTTVANYIRCYGCGKDYDEQQAAWLEHTDFLETSFYQARCEQSGMEP